MTPRKSAADTVGFKKLSGSFTKVKENIKRQRFKPATRDFRVALEGEKKASTGCPWFS